MFIVDHLVFNCQPACNQYAQELILVNIRLQAARALHAEGRVTQTVRRRDFVDKQTSKKKDRISAAL